MNNSNLNVSKTVLVVEDEYLIRDTLRDALETEGYQVLLASNGQEALEVLAAASHPDLILLDMMMPVMGGV
ncbi:MAG: response regulator, partial [Proteobacteria bacterium]